MLLFLDASDLGPGYVLESWVKVRSSAWPGPSVIATPLIGGPAIGDTMVRDQTAKPIQESSQPNQKTNPQRLWSSYNPSMKSRARKQILYECHLTHEGWAVICDGRILCSFKDQRQAGIAARALAQHSATDHTVAEVRLFKANGRLRSVRTFDPKKP